MQTSFIVLRIAVSFIAAAAADTTVIQNSTKAFHHDTDRNQKSTEKEEEVVFSEGEERAGSFRALNRLRGLFRSKMNTMDQAQLNKRYASEALAKVKSIVGLSKTPTKVTPTQLREL
ncbi:hypothetical protein PPTG_24572 [Phytophthora nicotianae INRA-310]|uniref:RxLR effector protein n=1 Tax=Phytophthora nicotianae (strain INRA-310) TaxID=761204 RepID=W2PEK1_PHYN3|nr:hypothetical protein PPTG_24572 [Phytophthora nicotianae INRA-310]ETM98638.1 hypothetical protein PPTG_24572 [Phytophthora nicotianae INRA-310]